MVVSSCARWRECMDNRQLEHDDAVTSATKHEHPCSYNRRAFQHRVGLVVLQAFVTTASSHPFARSGASIARRSVADLARATRGRMGRRGERRGARELGVTVGQADFADLCGAG